MPRGSPPKYPPKYREAFIKAVFDEGLPYTRVVKLIQAGELDGLEPIPLSPSTARGWRDKEERRRAKITPVSDSAIRDIFQDAVRVLKNEQRKLDRDSRKPKPLDPKRVNEHLAAIRTAASLHKQLGPRQPTQDPAQPAVAPAQQEPASLLERLAATQQPAAVETPTPHNGSGTTQPQVAPEPEQPQATEQSDLGPAPTPAPSNPGQPG